MSEDDILPEAEAEEGTGPLREEPRPLWQARGVVFAAAVAAVAAAAAVLVPPAATTYTRVALAPEGGLDEIVTGSVGAPREPRRYTVRRSILRPAGEACVIPSGGTGYGSC